MSWLQRIHFALLGMALLFSTAAQAQESTGRLVELPNVQLWITDTGGVGEPVILFHSRTATSALWQNNIPALAAEGYRVIALDTPGWGRSKTREGQTALSVAENIDALIDLLDLGQVHLIGTAAGGYFAFDFSAWRPERVRSLTIAASGLGLDDDPEGDAFRERTLIPGMRQQPPEIRELSPTYRGMNPIGAARWKAMADTAHQPGIIEPPLRTPNTPAKIASISVPTFVLAGGIDLTTPSGAVRLWAAHLTVDYEFLVVAEAGHMLVWEQPEVFNTAVIKFLGEH